MTTWFTSDLHFRHKNIMKYTDRGRVLGDISVKEHDEWLIDIWNSTVKPGDTVVHLGDFAFAEEDYIRKIISRLAGQKEFILGNHDSSKVMYKLKKDGVIHSVDNYREVRIGDTKTVLCHYPIASWNGMHRGSFMLHGHTHGSYYAEGKILDVGLDNAYNICDTHCFFNEDMILAYMSQKEIAIVDHHETRE